MWSIGGIDDSFDMGGMEDEEEFGYVLGAAASLFFVVVAAAVAVKKQHCHRAHQLNNCRMYHNVDESMDK